MNPLRTTALSLTLGLGLATAVACDGGDGGTDTDGASTSAGSESTDPSGSSSNATNNTNNTDGTGGESEGSTGDVGMVDYQTDIQPIWNKWCSCHFTDDGGMLTGAPYLDLTDGLSEQNLLELSEDPGADGMGVGLMRVEPGDPSSSFLWLKLTGGWIEAGGQTNYPNSDMPPIGDLSQEELDKIEAWILQFGG
ncbi:MAG: hypothetical protein KC468_11995 [Myxococcales bacterium]|nr:hypothetical protein [Myxococcales bacterium]